MLLREKEIAMNKMSLQIQRLELEAERNQNENHALLEKMEDLKASRDEATLKYKELEVQVLSQKTSIAVEYELESLKRQLKEAQKASEKRQEEHEVFLNKITGPQSQLKMELDIATINIAKWKQKCGELVNRLEAEVFTTYLV